MTAPLNESTTPLCRCGHPESAHADSTHPDAPQPCLKGIFTLSQVTCACNDYAPLEDR